MRSYMKHHPGILFTIALALFAVSCKARVDSVALFREMTAGKTLLSVQTGESTQFNESEKICLQSTCSPEGKNCKIGDHFHASPLMKGSQLIRYYQLSPENPVDSKGNPQYQKYGPDSDYAADLKALKNRMDSLMISFRNSGLLEELGHRGLTPALMFDIDNTLEFSAGPDSDPVGDGPAIQPMVDFANKWCFKDGIDCYFITARTCTESSVPPTEKWLLANLKFDDRVIRNHTHFSTNPEDLVCEGLSENISVAYKDLIRQAMEAERNIFWLMSVGDQLTDSLGEHSGMKVRVPNQFFQSDIVPNQFAPWGKGQCYSPHTMAPPAQCAIRLLPRAIQKTSLEYCRTKKG